MAGLRSRGLDRVLRRRVEDARPVLGICLGLQLALETTEEDGGVEALGVLPGRALRLAEGEHRRVPRIGWADVDGEAYYFAHSYAAETPAATAWSEGVVAEARLGSFVGVQFHPEKSGRAGARYLARLLAEWQLLADQKQLPIDNCYDSADVPGDRAGRDRWGRSPSRA